MAYFRVKGDLEAEAHEAAKSHAQAEASQVYDDRPKPVRGKVISDKLGGTRDVL